jgi:CRP/FNR family cyclic AMP-dependent transcriptional regulator
VSMRVHKDQRINLLKGVDLLSGCTKNELRQIASLTTELEAAPGQVLAEQGKPGQEFFILVEGRAKASRNGVVLATLAPTDFFGELALLDGGDRTATVVAETDLRLLVLSRGEFKHLCLSYPSVAHRMLAELGARLRRADEILGAEQTSDSLERVTL